MAEKTAYRIVAVSLTGDAHQNDRLVPEEGRSICEIEPGRKGGKPCDFLVNRVPIPTSSGKMIGGIVIDFTDWVRREGAWPRRAKSFFTEHTSLTGQISSSLAHGFNGILDSKKHRAQQNRDCLVPILCVDGLNRTHRAD